MRMLKTVSKLMLLVLAAQASPAAALGREHAVEVEAIRARFLEVNARQQTLRKDTKGVLGLAAEGAELAAWYDGGDLRKLVVTEMHEMNRSVFEVYFSSGAIDFIYFAQWNYQSTLSSKAERKTEDRYYFVDANLWWWTTGATRSPVPFSRYSSEGKRLQNLVGLYRKAAGFKSFEVRIDDGQATEVNP